jgi:hypothetical protein
MKGGGRGLRCATAKLTGSKPTLTPPLHWVAASALVCLDTPGMKRPRHA